MIRYSSLGVLLALWCWASWARPYTASPPIRSDGVGYHMWTKAFKSGDYSFVANQGAYDDFGCSLQKQTGQCVNKWSMGTGLLRYPFIWPFVDPQTPKHFSEVEEQFVHWFAGALLLFSGWLLLDTTARRGYHGFAPNFALLVVALGTGWFHYSTFDAGFSHAYSAFWASVLIWGINYAAQTAASSRQKASVGALLMITGVMMMLTRNTNVFLIAGSGLLGILWAYSAGRLGKLIGPLLCLGLGTILGEAIQLLYNSHATGTLVLSSYVDEGFLWDQPQQWSVLFSYKKGLFTYYPALLLVILNAAVVKAARVSLMPTLLVVVALATIYGFWHTWWLGGSFGHRGFVEVAPLFYMPTVVALAGLRGAFWRRFIPVVYVGLVLVSLRLMWAYWQGQLPYEGGTMGAYWALLRL